MSKDPSTTVKAITGTIEMVDGSSRQFSFAHDFGWQQWGATVSELGASGPVLDAIKAGLVDADIEVVSDNDEDDEYEPEVEPTYLIRRVYRDDREAEIVQTGLSMEDAKAHCSDPATASEDFMDTWTAE